MSKPWKIGQKIKRIGNSECEYQSRIGDECIVLEREQKKDWYKIWLVGRGEWTYGVKQDFIANGTPQQPDIDYAQGKLDEIHGVQA